MTDRYVFLRTAEKDGEVVALIGDTEILGDAGVKSLRHAFTAHAAPIVRTGVLTLKAEQMQERLPVFKQQGMKSSIAAFERAIECIHKKKGIAPNVPAAPSHKLS